MVRARARDPHCPSPVVGLHSAEGARVPGQERQQLRPRGRPTTSVGLLTNLTAATNGAKTDNFKETSFLLVLAILNNNYPQTRKGAGHRAGLKIGRAIDDHVLQAATARVLQHLRAQYDEDHAKCREVAPSPPDDRHPAVRALRVESSTLSSFIEETFFQRCCGDWNQVTPSERHDLNDRFFYGTSVNLDEAYRFLKTLGLFPDSGRGRNQDSGTTTSADAASEVQRLYRTGFSNMATKTAGSFGQGDVHTVSSGLHGNGHPPARLSFKGFQTVFDAQCAAARDDCSFWRRVSVPAHGIQQCSPLAWWSWRSRWAMLSSKMGLRASKNATCCVRTVHS